MITIYDRASMVRVLSLNLDPQLRGLLERCFASLVTADGWTCPGKVESSLEIKGELDDEETTVYAGV